MDAAAAAVGPKVQTASGSDIEVQIDLCDRPRDENGEEVLDPGVPASEFNREIDNSWSRMRDYAEPVINRAAGVLEAVFKKFDIAGCGRKRVPSAIPAMMMIAVATYATSVSVSLLITSLHLFLAWEELLVIETFAAAWILSQPSFRAYVATEHSRAMRNRHPDYALMHKIFAHVQSRPVSSLVIALMICRLVVRSVAFFIWPLLLIETACENTAVFIAAIASMLFVWTAHDEVVPDAARSGANKNPALVEATAINRK